MAFWLAMRGAEPFQLEPGVDVTIGRGQHCELSVYSTLLSREHARVRWEGEQPVIFDLESLNGCFVGLDRISRYAMKDGDVVRLGDLLVQFRECDEPPPSLEDDEVLPAPTIPGLAESADEPLEAGGETRLFSRSTALHQKVFEYDELFWLLERIEPQSKWLLDPWLAEKTLAMWYQNLEPGQHPLLWRLLELGIVAPKDPKVDLSGKKPLEVAGACALTKRGERLRSMLQQKKVHWNEMAALRYRVRQGPIFKALRLVARAYRPGGGLRELDVERLLYELHNIYAAEMDAALLEHETRRLLCLGFLSPREGMASKAWYPESWTNETVVIAQRGFAMLEGFRLEE